jgi:hypothetical protein
MVGLLSLLLLQGSMADIDLSDLTLKDAVSQIRRLPAGHGEFVVLPVVDGAAIWTSQDHGASLAKTVRDAADLAHSSGYRVMAFWDCFEWKGVKDLNGAADIVEFQADDAFDRKPQFDWVSPVSHSVRQCLLDYAGVVSKAGIKVDRLMIRYAMPLGPVLAYGKESRQQYVDEASIDPVDLPEQTSLHYESQRNEAELNYMKWRIDRSDEFAVRLLPKIFAAFGNAPTALRSDFLWDSRDTVHQGAELNDWPNLIGVIPGVAIATGYREKSFLEPATRLKAFLLANGARPDVWIINADSTSSEFGQGRQEFLDINLNVTTFQRAGGAK